MDIMTTRICTVAVKHQIQMKTKMLSRLKPTVGWPYIWKQVLQISKCLAQVVQSFKKIEQKSFS